MVSLTDFTISLRNQAKHIQPSGNTQFLDEKPEALQKRLQDEYGGADKDFYEKLHEVCLDVLPSQNRNTALDVGCGCGRLTFDLAKNFKEV